MSPNNVKALKLIAEELGVPGRGFNPLLNRTQSDDLQVRYNLTVENESQFTTLAVWVVRLDGKSIYRFTGGDRNEAIVEAVAMLIDPDWYKKPLFGIDFRFDPAGWKDAAGPV